MISLPRGSIYTTIMELGPRRPSLLWFWEPNSITHNNSVYGPFGLYVPPNPRTHEALQEWCREFRFFSGIHSLSFTVCAFHGRASKKISSRSVVPDRGATVINPWQRKKCT